MRALKQALADANPPDFVRDWIRAQPLEVQGWLADLQFSMGGHPVVLIEDKIIEQGWDVPRHITAALAASVARAPEYHTDANGKGYMLVRSSRGPVRLDVFRATGTVQSGPSELST
ncbi:hypothetical protein [Microlunatus sp. Gsoil 973]|uniref:hypothetical protein n=1 Tax=Microlunatus sp. Gsoil 973 TaxID=2672569 RepID=UPI0012B45A39|nr:hypothetical protein [Microlunatus sp. Gsoil 973]QGN32300.1 hypothetical protein GJV80_05285 [Microlunatus sp. Gsoil 973]